MGKQYLGTGGGWDERFLRLAEHVAGWSKDPSTQCGAVIVSGKRVVGLGFNGLPQGVEDTPLRLHDRDTKLKMILHAEENAVLFAQKTEGCTIYVWPMPPCAKCMGLLIQAGISRIVSPETHDERWSDSVGLARQMAEEAGCYLDLRSFYRGAS